MEMPNEGYSRAKDPNWQIGFTASTVVYIYKSI